MFAGFVDEELPACRECDAPEDHCDTPQTLTIEGELTEDRDHPDAAVRFPRCPRLLVKYRRYGVEVLTLADLVRWQYEQGVHREAGTPAGAMRLYREFSLLEPLPKRIADGKRARLRRIRAKQEELRRGLRCHG